MNKKNKSKKEQPKFSVKSVLASKGFYIALVALITVFGTTAIVKKLAPTPSAPDSSFDSLAWEDAVNEATDDEEVQDIILPDDEPVSEDFPVVTAPVSKQLSEEEILEKLGMIFPVKGDIIKEHSPDELLYYESMGDWRTHNGIDIAGDKGAIVFTAADGVVEEVFEDDRLGIVVVIGHEGNIKTLYGNLADKKFIEVGRKVSKGDAVGSIGNSSVLEGEDKSHLHFEVTKNGETQNPSQYISL
ncbi:MAG: M23 family metallopeptidase [Clostridia bacterium]|nr:M23 family metallopeptidase [Clostridia bacterium]